MLTSRHAAIWVCCAILLCGFAATHEQRPPRPFPPVGGTLIAHGPIAEPPETAREKVLAELLCANERARARAPGVQPSHQPSAVRSALQRLQYLFTVTHRSARAAEPLVDCADLGDEGLEAHPPSFRVCRVTAYCDQGITASGVQSGIGQCAAPEDIPFGSLVYIPDLDRTFVVTDRTHWRFRLNTVDIFIPSEDECLEFGLNYLDCEFILPPSSAPAAELTSAGLAE